VCAKCNGRLGEVTEAAARPQAPGAVNLIARVFSLEGLLTAAGIAVGLALLSRIPGIGRVFYIVSLATLVAYYFQIISHVGNGKEGLPGPSDTTELGEIVSMTLRGAFCTLLGFLPLLVWYWRGGAAEAKSLGDALFTVGGLLLLGQLYMPAVLVAIVVTESTGAAFYPVAWVKVIARAPLQYLVLVALFVLTAILGFVGERLAAVLVGFVPFVGGVIVAAVGNLLLFMQAAFVGGFLRANADRFGWD